VKPFKKVSPLEKIKPKPKNMRDYYGKMEADKFYHVLSRGNNKENLFYKPENYEFFLRRFDQYLSAFLNTYAFCLLPNHFHMLVQVKSDEEVQAKYIEVKTF
jgi:REP element-mobilizing transposase RayT